MIRHCFGVLVPLLLAALPFWASVAQAQIPARLNGRRVVSVRVEGETSGATGADEVGIVEGTNLSRRLLRETTRRRLEGGRWAGVQFDARTAAGGVELSVHLTPRGLITRVDIVGNEAGMGPNHAAMAESWRPQVKARRRSPHRTQLTQQ